MVSRRRPRHSGRHLGCPLQEGHRTGRGDRGRQTVTGGPCRAVEHLHRVVRSLCSAVDHAWPAHGKAPQ
eukprot:8401162-Alexandrium_andersonii.AAC.1